MLMGCVCVMDVYHVQNITLECKHAMPLLDDSEHKAQLRQECFTCVCSETKELRNLKILMVQCQQHLSCSDYKCL